MAYSSKHEMTLFEILARTYIPPLPYPTPNRASLCTTEASHHNPHSLDDYLLGPFFICFQRTLGIFVHENELYSKIVHKLLATNFTIWPNSNSQKNYQANSKTINRINENCLSVQVLPSSKLFWLIFFNTRVFNLGPCKFPSHFIQSGLEWVP